MNTPTSIQYQDSKTAIRNHTGDMRDHVIVSLWESGEKLVERDIALRSQLAEALKANVDLRQQVAVATGSNDPTSDLMSKIMARSI